MPFSSSYSCGLEKLAQLPPDAGLQSPIRHLWEKQSYNQGGGTMPEPSRTSAAKPLPNPNEKLIRVFDTEQESEALVVRGLLESQGIDSDITSLDAQQDILPGVGGTVIVVREEDAAQARQVIESYRSAPGTVEPGED